LPARRKAAEVAKEMTARGQRLKGVRIDSGDLSGLAIKVRNILDDAGFPDIKIIGSGGLNEYDLTELSGAQIPFDSYGAGDQDGHLQRYAMVRYGLQTC
jgi:nicotinate phosphoribosyltransferase